MQKQCKGLKTLMMKLKMLNTFIHCKFWNYDIVLPVYTTQKYLCHLTSLLAVPPSPNTEPNRPSLSDLPYFLTATRVSDGWYVYPLAQDHGGTRPWHKGKYTKQQWSVMHIFETTFIFWIWNSVFLWLQYMPQTLWLHGTNIEETCYWYCRFYGSKE